MPMSRLLAGTLVRSLPPTDTVPDVGEVAPGDGEGLAAKLGLAYNVEGHKRMLETIARARETLLA